MDSRQLVSLNQVIHNLNSNIQYKKKLCQKKLSTSSSWLFALTVSCKKLKKKKKIPAEFVGEGEYDTKSMLYYNLFTCNNLGYVYKLY